MATDPTTAAAQQAAATQAKLDTLTRKLEEYAVGQSGEPGRARAQTRGVRAGPVGTLCGDRGHDDGPAGGGGRQVQGRRRSLHRGLEAPGAR
eukprot:3935559-Heterocapsa_arctica.AAC.1